MSRSPLVLIVDDDPRIREVVRFALRREGFETLEACDGVEALRAFDRHRPDLVILDILMPEMDGTEVSKKLREHSGVPVIFLTSKDEELDRVLGLEMGADDYVTKPFSPRELVARVRAVLRRLAPSRTAEASDAKLRKSGKVTHGQLRLDLDRYQSYWGDTEVELTATEFGVLGALMSFPGKVYTREELMAQAYDGETIVSGRTIDSHIRRIRGKFSEVGGDPIQTAHGLGYKLGNCD